MLSDDTLASLYTPDLAEFEAAVRRVVPADAADRVAADARRWHALHTAAVTAAYEPYRLGKGKVGGGRFAKKGDLGIDILRKLLRGNGSARKDAHAVFDKKLRARDGWGRGDLTPGNLNAWATKAFGPRPHGPDGQAWDAGRRELGNYLAAIPARSRMPEAPSPLESLGVPPAEEMGFDAPNVPHAPALAKGARVMHTDGRIGRVRDDGADGSDHVGVEFRDSMEYVPKANLKTVPDRGAPGAPEEHLDAQGRPTGRAKLPGVPEAGAGNDLVDRGGRPYDPSMPPQPGEFAKRNAPAAPEADAGPDWDSAPVGTEARHNGPNGPEWWKKVDDKAWELQDTEDGEEQVLDAPPDGAEFDGGAPLREDLRGATADLTDAPSNGPDDTDPVLRGATADLLDAEDDTPDAPDAAQQGDGTRENPFVTDDVAQAAAWLAEDKHVRLNSVEQVSTLLDKLHAEIQGIKAAGGEAPNINLCNVSVPGTNLFCAENVGKPRIQMPQLSGKPIPGSPADALPKDPKGGVDLGPLFIEHLKSRGIRVTEKSYPASHLRASQNELLGNKVLGMMKSVEEGRMGPARIFTSRDQYVVDGHHRWAANVGADLADGELGGLTQDVNEVDADILDVLAMANAFAVQMGIPQAAMGQNDHEAGHIPNIQPLDVPEVGAGNDLPGTGGMPNAGTPADAFEQDALKPRVSYGKPSPSVRMSDDDFKVMSEFGSAAQHIVGRNEDGSPIFTPERQALHQQIVDELLAGVQPSDNPTFYMLGGGPAAGKSTMLKDDRVDVPGEGEAVTIDSDAIKGKLPEYQQMIADDDPDAANFAHEESSYLAKLVMATAFDQNLPTMLDGTGDSSAKSVQKKIDAARAAGYRVQGMYATVPTEVAMARAIGRGRTEGRVVPPSVIEGTHASISGIFGDLTDMFDDIMLFENGNGPNLIAEAHGPGTAQIHDQGQYDEFLAKATRPLDYAKLVEAFQSVSYVDPDSTIDAPSPSATFVDAPKKWTPPNGDLTDAPQWTKVTDNGRTWVKMEDGRWGEEKFLTEADIPEELRPGGAGVTPDLPSSNPDSLDSFAPDGTDITAPEVGAGNDLPGAGGKALGQRAEASDPSGWDRQAAAAIATGDLSPDDVTALGGNPSSEMFSIGGGHADKNNGQGGWAPLPAEMWHATTAGDAVMAEGLKSGSEGGGKGLGGSSGNAISLAESKDHAEAVARGILEARAAAVGDTTLADMVKRSVEGDGGSKPFGEQFVGQMRYSLGLPDTWQPGDPIPEEADTPRNRTDMWQRFAFMRDRAGGPRDPLVTSSAEKLAEIDPAQVKVVKLAPASDKAMGVPLTGLKGTADEGEWRVPTGAALRPVEALAPEGAPGAADAPDAPGGEDRPKIDPIPNIPADGMDLADAEEALNERLRTLGVSPSKLDVGYNERPGFGGQDAVITAPDGETADDIEYALQGAGLDYTRTGNQITYDGKPAPAPRTEVPGQGDLLTGKPIEARTATDLLDGDTSPDHIRSVLKRGDLTDAQREELRRLLPDSTRTDAVAAALAIADRVADARRTAAVAAALELADRRVRPVH